MEFLKGDYRNLTLQSLQTFFVKLSGASQPISATLIEKCFLFSMMTIKNENKDGKKYEHLYFVEFLEFLCRMALNIIKINDGVEYKV